MQRCISVCSNGLQPQRFLACCKIAQLQNSMRRSMHFPFAYVSTQFAQYSFQNHQILTHPRPTKPPSSATQDTRLNRHDDQPYTQRPTNDSLKAAEPQPYSTTQHHNPTKPNALGHRNKRRPNTNTVKAPTTGKRPQQHNTTNGPSGQPARCQRSGLTSGNVIVSRIVAPVNAMSSRSMPMPMPPAGGMPTPSASRKSSSMSPASSSPASESFA